VISRVLSPVLVGRDQERLEERGLTAEREELELKGFDVAQPAYRLVGVAAAADRPHP
jgi:hypothetical protein